MKLHASLKKLVYVAKSFITEFNNRILQQLSIFKVNGFKTEHKYNPPAKSLKKKDIQCV